MSEFLYVAILLQLHQEVIFEIVLFLYFIPNPYLSFMSL